MSLYIILYVVLFGPADFTYNFPHFLETQKVTSKRKVRKKSASTPASKEHLGGGAGDAVSSKGRVR